MSCHLTRYILCKQFKRSQPTNTMVGTIGKGKGSGTGNRKSSVFRLNVLPVVINKSIVQQVSLRGLGIWGWPTRLGEWLNSTTCSILILLPEEVGCGEELYSIYMTLNSTILCFENGDSLVESKILQCLTARALCTFNMA